MLLCRVCRLFDAALCSLLMLFAAACRRVISFYLCFLYFLLSFLFMTLARMILCGMRSALPYDVAQLAAALFFFLLLMSPLRCCFMLIRHAAPATPRLLFFFFFFFFFFACCRWRARGARSARAQRVFGMRGRWCCADARSARQRGSGERTDGARQQAAARAAASYPHAAFFFAARVRLC